MITIYDWFGYELPITKRYQLIKEAGFDGVLLWWRDGFNRNDYRNGPQIARDAGLLIENIHTPIQNEDNLWLDNLDGEQVDSQRIGFCYDCGHHYRYYPEIDLLSLYGSRLMALHLHDNWGKAMHRLPFDGKIDWPTAIKDITATGYRGATAIEAMNWDYRNLTAEDFLHRAFEQGKRLETLRNELIKVRPDLLPHMPWPQAPVTISRRH